MKNTRLYFDKDMKPITKYTLQMLLPGATPNFETDKDIIVRNYSGGVFEWIGTSRAVCQERTGHTFDEILDSPNLLAPIQRFSYYLDDVYISGEDPTTTMGFPYRGPIPPSDKYFGYLLTSDIIYRIQSVDSLEITNATGATVTPDSYNISDFLKLNIIKTADYSILQNQRIYFETSLSKILGSKYNPTTDKWFKIKLRYTAGILLTEAAKLYFETDDTSEMKQRTATYYIVNTDYQAPQP